MTEGEIVLATLVISLFAIPVGMWRINRYLRTDDEVPASDRGEVTSPRHPAWVTVLAQIATSLEHLQRVNAVGEFTVLPVCQKCGVGNNRITTDYVNGRCGAHYHDCVFAVTLRSPRGLLFPGGAPSTEHVHRGCSGCGFRWIERPLDFVDGGNDRGE